MPRDSSGNYILPAGNPVISGDVITTAWANPTMDDISAALSDSLSRTGKGSMLIPFRNADGNIASPGMSWTNEPSSGWYRAGTNDFRYSVAGQDIFKITANGIELPSGKTALGISNFTRIQDTEPGPPEPAVKEGEDWYESDMGARYMRYRNPDGTFTWIMMNGVVSGDWSKIPDGILSAPGLAFNSDQDNGLYRIGPNNWALVAGATSMIELTPTQIKLNATLSAQGIGATGLAVTGTSALAAVTATTLAVSGALTAGSFAVTNLSVTNLTASGSVTASGAVTGGSFNAPSLISFTLGGAEKARINTPGFFKASNNASYFDSGSSYHELINTTANFICGFGNSSSSPIGIVIAYSATPNNAGQNFVTNMDTAASVVRSALMSNGGYRGYMSNNVDLSDVSAKQDIAPLSPATLETLWDAHRDVTWCSFRYKDQAHDDPNIGYIAQDIEAKFKGVASWLVEELDGMKHVYTHDLNNIAHALLSECQRRIEALESRLQ